MVLKRSSKSLPVTPSNEITDEKYVYCLETSVVESQNTPLLDWTLKQSQVK